MNNYEFFEPEIFSGNGNSTQTFDKNKIPGKGTIENNPRVIAIFTARLFYENDRTESNKKGGFV